ncbi:Crp/Fnr family transcriptional regulator [Rubrivivax gelatinosus]|uniref:Crp/Fnr family transcriptional regulator n=1 Tax=Rubrivivax gelatinosus TaxID=28068 RepID=UPI001903DA11|nr:Crp/Fnr family transcriptional regulator [Rubrivivax gelatinosus]MBK1615934.1 Crp/Fnr family transcriptional regulator [Rubrivivax gelatinosus]
MPAPLLPAELADTVRAGAWFASLPEDLADHLLALARPQQLAAGKRLFARGDAADGLYAIVRGVMRFGAVTGPGQEALLAMLEPPQWFGEIALFDGAARTHDAWAETDCTLLHVPQHELVRLLAARPRHWQAFGRLLTNKLRLTFAAVEELALLPPTPRLARRLAAMAGGYGAWQGRSKRVLEVSQEQLGLMLALSRQTVNQSLKELEAAGLLRRSRGAIEILDLARLAGGG